ncbi:diguanylate cyclase [Bacillus sp. HMF5848]|uniref:sensor domain-containing diguanylate cyclase n=1 Tax=Bacillus sp. HMF5848 TaxID=2495421 RepID=UPI000F778A55|nr:diguanylate cyclase [Bacillus sp. HMF5848]RSK27650.1 diguanylate cyclase [Bacillus sp. HMF5848]
MMCKTKWLLHIFIFLIMLSVSPEAVQGSTLPKGTFDATSWDFEQDGLLRLQSEWELYPSQLIEPDAFVNGTVSSTPIYITTPTDLTSIVHEGERFPADGYGTLHLKVKLDQLKEIYGLKNLYMSSSYKVWVNGELLQTAGQVARTKENYKPSYMPMVAMFKTDEEIIDIVVHISNFHHRRVRLSTFYLGTADAINDLTNKGTVKDSVLFGSLVLISLYHFILYVLRRNEKVFLYFSIIAVVVGLRVGIVNERLLLTIFPDLQAELMMKIGYLPDFILLPLLILYIREIFQSKELAWPARIATYAIPIFTIVIFATNVKVYDFLFQYGLWVIIGFGTFVIYLLFKNVFLQRKSGSFVMIVGGLAVLLTAINDTLRELDIIHSQEMLTTGVLIFILLQAFYLAWRYNDAFNRAVRLAQENEAMYEEIQVLNEDLERKIELRTLELTHANGELKRLVNTDPLTELPNRRCFDDRLQEEWNHSHVTKQPLSILLIDIDSFKSYNDFYGHLQGDESLKKVAEQLQRNVRSEVDMVARFGGEEFVVLLSNTDANKADRVAEQLRQAIENLQLRHNRSSVSDIITISVGVYSTIVTEDTTIEQIIMRADEALYVAKDKGRNCVQSYESWKMMTKVIAD